MYWAMRAPEADMKRNTPVVLLAMEEQEAEVCTPCHYIGFEDVPDREKRFHIKTQLRGCSTLHTVRTDRGENTAGLELFCEAPCNPTHSADQPQIMLIN